MHHLGRVAGVLLVAGLLAACKDSSAPLVPANLEAVFTAPTGIPAGALLPSPPSVRVTGAGGQPIAGVAVTFAVTAGGGLIAGATQVTNASGVATPSSWQTGTVVGLNTLTASVAGLTPVQFSVTTVPGTAAKLGVTTAPTTEVQNRQQFPTQPVVQVQDAFGNAVAQGGVVVAASLSSAGTLLGTTSATTNASGTATFTDLAIAGTTGFKVVNFTATLLTSVAAELTTTAGPATSIVVHLGDAQSAGAGTSVHTPPAARVADVDGNGVPGVLVTFAVESGGGSITGPTAVTNGSGVATVGSWTLGSASGSNTLSATASISITGNPLTFSATGVPFNITSVTPALLAPGVTGTVTGTGFSATAADNAITVDGASAVVLTASATQLTFVVPNNVPCQATHDGTVVLTIAGGSITRTHAVQPGFLRTLAPGQMIVIGDPAQTRCNELSSTGGLYYVNVHNTSETVGIGISPTAFELRGAAASGSAALNASPLNATLTPALARDGAGTPIGGAREPALPRRAPMHYRVLEENTRYLERNARGHFARLQARARRNPARPALTKQAAVGDQVTLRIPDLNSSAGICRNYFEITGRVVYQGTRSIIVEDNGNPLAGSIDTTYAAIGQEFDNVMFDILSTNFGNPLAMDDVTDNNDRIVMLFTNRINQSFPGLAGFVISCDFFPRDTGSNQSSNFGEYFYARVPTVSGSINTQDSPPSWSWLMRSTIIHEAKHITSFAERISRDADEFEDSWLEESTATISEELYGRAIYGLAQRANIPYGGPGNPKGPYCDVRPGVPACQGSPFTVFGLFQGLNRGWYASPEIHTPLGRITNGDFSFYDTGWSLVRWAADQFSGAEAAFLKGLTQATSESGTANLAARSGRPFAQMLPEWTFALALDDHPSFTTTLPNLRMPSWNLRDVFDGMNRDFPSTFTTSWPFTATLVSFGAFSTQGGVIPGTSKFYQLSGLQSAKQLIELKASGSGADAPASLRIAIVRVQ